MTISIVTGLPGSGKTSKLCEFGVKAMNRGKKVYANFRMQNLPHPHLFNHYNDPLEVLGKVENALVLMSEVGILLDSFKIWELPHEVWDELRQHRKDGVNIIADAQSLDDCASRFRRLIQFQYHIYSKTNLGPLGTYQLVKVTNPQPKGADYGRNYWRLNKKWFKYYDTNYKLEKTPSLYELSQSQIESPWSQYEYEQYVLMLQRTQMDNKPNLKMTIL